MVKSCSVQKRIIYVLNERKLVVLLSKQGGQAEINKNGSVADNSVSQLDSSFNRAILPAGSMTFSIETADKTGD